MLSFGIGFTSSMRVWQLRTLVNPLLVGRFASADGVAFVALAVRIAEALGTLRLAAGRMGVAGPAWLLNKRGEIWLRGGGRSFLERYDPRRPVFRFFFSWAIAVAAGDRIG